MKKTFSEIAKVLMECGIKGITDERISSLENRFASLPEGIMLDRTAALLSELGSGDMNYDTMEWKPSENGVYSFDVEVFDISKMYTNFLLGIQSIGNGEIVVSDIVEDDSEVDWENDSGEIKVSFMLNGSSYTVNAQAMGDWFDLQFANAISDIIQKNDKRLWFASDGYQECIVFYGDEQWAEKFSERTGVELARSLS